MSRTQKGRYNNYNTTHPATTTAASAPPLDSPTSSDTTASHYDQDREHEHQHTHEHEQLHNLSNGQYHSGYASGEPSEGDWERSDSPSSSSLHPDSDSISSYKASNSTFSDGSQPIDLTEELLRSYLEKHHVHLNNFTDLQLASSNIMSLPKAPAFLMYSSLLSINLSYNMLTSPDLAALSPLRSLTSCIVAFNKIDSFSYLPFLPALSMLDLTANHVQVPELSTLTCLELHSPSLTRLVLTGNPCCFDKEYRTIAMEYLSAISSLISLDNMAIFRNLNDDIHAHTHAPIQSSFTKATPSIRVHRESESNRKEFVASKDPTTSPAANTVPHVEYNQHRTGNISSDSFQPLPEIRKSEILDHDCYFASSRNDKLVSIVPPGSGSSNLSLPSIVKPQDEETIISIQAAMITNLKEQLEKMRQTLATESTKYQRLKLQHEDLQYDLKLSKEEKTVAQSQLENMRLQLDSVKQVCSIMEKESAELKGAEVNGLAYWRQIVYTIILKSKKDEVERHKLLQILEETETKNTFNVMQLEKELEKTLEEKKRLESSIEILQADYSHLEMENRNLSSQVSQATTVLPLLQAFPNTVDNWEISLHQYFEQITRMCDRITELIMQVEAIKLERSRFINEVNEMKKSLDHNIAEERTYREALEVRCDELHRALTEEAHQREEADALNKRLYQDNSEEMQSLQSEMHRESAKLQSDLKKIIMERDQLQLTIRKLKVDLRTSHIAHEQQSRTNGKELERISQLELQLQRREKLLEKVRLEKEEAIENLRRHGNLLSSPSPSMPRVVTSLVHEN